LLLGKLSTYSLAAAGLTNGVSGNQRALYNMPFTLGLHYPRAYAQGIFDVVCCDVVMGYGSDAADSHRQHADALIIQHFYQLLDRHPIPCDFEKYDIGVYLGQVYRQPGYFSQTFSQLAGIGVVIRQAVNHFG
jgi:hypothetical protein